MTKIPKWLKVALVICVPLGIVVAFLVESLIKTAPERVQALQVAQSNQSVLAWFGDGTKVTDHSDYPVNVAAFLDGKREGEYCFRVAGSKQSGKIVVEWTSHREKQQFSVTRIRHYVANGEKDVVIWQSNY